MKIAEIVGHELTSVSMNDITIQRLLHEEGVTKIDGCCHVVGKETIQSKCIIGIICSIPIEGLMSFKVSICDINCDSIITVIFDNQSGKMLPYPLELGCVVLLLNPSFSVSDDRILITMTSQKNVVYIGAVSCIDKCGGICRNGLPCKMPINKENSKFCKFHRNQSSNKDSILGIKRTADSNDQGRDRILLKGGSLSSSSRTTANALLSGKAQVPSKSRIESAPSVSSLKDNVSKTYFRMGNGVIVDVKAAEKNAQAFSNNSKKDSQTSKQDNTSTVEQKKKLLSDLDSLLAMKPSFYEEQKAEALKSIIDKTAKILKKDEYVEKASKKHYVYIRGYYCTECKNAGDKISDYCTQHHHNVISEPIVKRFFECRQCYKRESTYSRDDNRLHTNQSNKKKNDIESSSSCDVGELIHAPTRRCSCGAYNWIACGKYGSMDSLRAQGARDDHLVVSTSDWVKHSDIHSMKTRLGNLES